MKLRVSAEYLLRFIHFILGKVLNHTAKSLNHTKVSTRVEFSKNIFKMENITQKKVLPLNGKINPQLKCTSLNNFEL